MFSQSSTRFANQTALIQFHKDHQGKIVEFCGWDMPVTYGDQSLIESHLWTRKSASLFDVSHMLQTRWTGKDVVAFLHRITVADLNALKDSQSTLSLFTNSNGGIIDDTVINKESDTSFYIVSNAGCRDKDIAHFKEQLAKFKSENPDSNVSFEILDRSLIALQGPKAVSVVEKLLGKSLTDLEFMHSWKLPYKGKEFYVSRCGYTGEDGFEISLPHESVVDFANELIKDESVKLAGLGPRDSLRLEAGLCLYGHDLDDTVSPIEGALTWTIGKARRSQIGIQNGGFIGSEKILPQIKGGVERKRIGLVFPKGSPPAREGVKLYDANDKSKEIGVITSGSPSPSLGFNIAMGYVKNGFHKNGTDVIAKVRNKDINAKIAKTPFVPSTYYRKETK